MAERSYRKWLWALAVVGLTLDLGSKYGAFHWLWTAHRHFDPDYRHPPVGLYELVPGYFELRAAFTTERDAGTSVLSPLRTWGIEYLPVVNNGALFNLGGRYGADANTVFAVVSLLAALGIMWWSTRADTARDGFLCAALGLILGGALGNLYDRVVFHGVRDFLHFHWKDVFDWPVFNIADCCLVCGAFLLLVQAFFSPVPAPETPAHPTAASETAPRLQTAEVE